MSGTDFMLQREWLDRLQRESLADLVEIMQSLATAMLDKNRMAFGDVELSHEETVQKVAEAVRSGEYEALQGIAPREARRWVSEAGQAVERLAERDGR